MNFYRFRKANFYKFLIAVLALVFVLLNFRTFAQETPNSTSSDSNSTTAQTGMTPHEERKALEEELERLEEQLLNIDKDVEKTESERRTLQNQIYLLRRRVEKLNVQIQQSNIMIQDVGLQIKDTGNSIIQTSSEIEKSEERLIVILRTIYEEDQKSLIEILLSEEKISDFFDDLIALETLDAKNYELLQNIKDLKLYLQDQEESLGEEKMDLETMLKVQMLQRQQSSGLKEEQEYFLKLTEDQYEKYLEEKTVAEKRAAEIRTRIFELIGVPKAPTFGEAYEIAKYVSNVTGIRPALLLAVLTQESNIGRNVGQCYLLDTESGEGVRITNGERESRTMNPKRDLPYFLDICQKLGRDPLNTPVSCPMKDKYGRPVGWGGAMGPAQFIPDTWANPKYGYSERVKEIIGKEADPWDIKDAFLASGLYLKDAGALKDEFKGVMRYFSGYRWSKWEEFYGRSVLKIASQYEEDIREL